MDKKWSKCPKCSPDKPMVRFELKDLNSVMNSESNLQWVCMNCGTCKPFKHKKRR